MSQNIQSKRQWGLWHKEAYEAVKDVNLVILNISSLITLPECVPLLVSLSQVPPKLLPLPLLK